MTLSTARGVGMVDEFMRQKRVQHHLDRRIGRCRIDQVGALDARPALVGDRVERAQPPQRRKPHRRQSGRLDRRHVGAGRLDAQHLDVFAEDDRACASSARYCRRHAAQAWDRGRAAASCRCAAPGRGRCRTSAPSRDERFGVTVDPAAFHGVAAAGSAAGEAARPPAAAARLIACFRRRRVR